MLCWKMLSETKDLNRSSRRKCVLILVVLEDAIGVQLLTTTTISYSVLILVVLEDAIGEFSHFVLFDLMCVLILVVLEDAIGGKDFPQKRKSNNTS